MTATADKAPARPRLRIDMGSLTLRELDDIAEQVFQDLGMTLADGMQSHRQNRVTAIVAWHVARRDNPAITLDDILDRRMVDYELVAADPETPGGGNGTAPVSSPEPGT